MNKNCIMLPVMAFAAILSLVSCSDSNDEPGGGDGLALAEFNIFVHFLKEDGTNAADYVKLEKVVTDSTENYIYLPIEEEGSVQALCTRESDGLQCELSKDAGQISSGHAGWVNYSTLDWHEELVNAGTLLWLGWVDFLTAFPDDPDYNRPDNYDEAYTIVIRSQKLFGNDEEHTIKWFVHVKWNIVDAYRCEVDGDEFDFMNEPYYKKYFHEEWNYAPIGPVVIPVKVKYGY